ncbi:MAG: hypothetical protein AAF591_03755 [Verrucomicrobiota bacterium]
MNAPNEGENHEHRDRLTVDSSSWWREGAAFAFALVVALWNQWDARDLLWGAWAAAVVSGFVLLSLPSLFILVPGSERLLKRDEEEKEVKMGFFGRIFGACFLIAFIAAPITSFLVILGMFLRGIAPEPVAEEFYTIPYLREAFAFAIKNYWPVVLIVTITEVWRTIVVMRDNATPRFIIVPIADFLRLLGLSIILGILIAVGSSTLAVIPALAILFIPPEAIFNFFENLDSGRRRENPSSS